MSVSKKRLHTKQTTLHFFVRNGERSPLSLLKHISIPSIRSISGNMTQVSGDLTVNRCEHRAQPLFLICDWKHDEINPVRKVTRFKNVPMSAE